MKPGGLLLRVVAAAALVGAALVAGPPGPARAGGSTRSADAVTVVLSSVSPVSVSDGQTLALQGTVHAGSSPVTGLRLEVGVGEAVSSRTTLLRRFTASSLPGDDDTEPVDVTLPLADCGTCLAGQTTSVPAGGSVAFAVSVPLGTRLRRSVVSAYPLVVRLAGTAGNHVATSLGEADSWLPYFPGAVAAPLRVSWVWPIDAAPAQAADGSIADAGFPGSLATAGAIGSQLAGTAAAAQGQVGLAPVTYAVEPSLVQAAAAVAQDGWHRAGDDTAEPASAAAATFLATLRAATQGRGVVALPYADPDAAAVVHAGQALDLTNALSTGASDLAASLPGAAVLPGVGWLPGAAFDQTELDAYAAAGSATLVLPGGQLAVPDDVATPTATAITSLPTSRGPTVRGLVTDPDVETLLATGGRDQPSPAMSAQRLLALLAVVVAEAPNGLRQRDVLLAVPRGTDPAAAWAQAVLADTGSVSWLQAVTLADTGADAAAAREPLASYPTSARDAELPASTFTDPRTGVAAQRTKIAAATSLFDASAAADTTKPLDLALTRAESYAWRSDTAGSVALRDGTAGLTTALTRQVGLASARTVTLASNSASIPVTVENGLAHTVTVSLALSSMDRTKIEPLTRTVTVPAGRKLRVLLPAEVDRAGTFRATITMRTPSGLEIGVAPISVHSRAYNALTLAITVGALAVLVLALLGRGVRRLRQRRRATS